MAVLKQKRTESGVQFIDTALQLEIFTLKNCAKFPKRYTFLITNEIVRLSQSVYNNVKAANSVYATNNEELKLRIEYLIKANCDLQCLISQLCVAKEIFGEQVKTNSWCKWMDLIEKESKLIAAIKKKDKERLSDNI